VPQGQGQPAVYCGQQGVGVYWRGVCWGKGVEGCRGKETRRHHMVYRLVDVVKEAGPPGELLGSVLRRRATCSVILWPARCGRVCMLC
jgi:hypothetical protein